MVKKFPILVLLLIGLISFSFIPGAFAQRQYHFGQEWAKIWINQDGSIDLFYNVSLTLDSGQEINWVSIGQPKGDFTIGSAADQFGNSLTTQDISSGSDYKVRVNFDSPLQAGQTIWFTLITNVAHMIYVDETNQGNDGMQFILSWFSEASILNARVLIVVPPGVLESEIKTGEILWSNLQSEDNRLAVYWEKQNLSPGEKFSVGVSYPKQEGWTSFSQNSNGLFSFLENLWPLLIIGFIGVVILFLAFRKQPYKKPTVGIECLGIVRGLTAIEASYLLDLKPPQIVTEILFSVLKKRAVWVEKTSPSLTFKILEPFLSKTGTTENPLRYYEIDFLNAINDDGTLDEKKLASAIMFIQSTVEEKLKGYCRGDTVDYYRKIVDKAWGQVEAAGTSELTSKAYDEQLLWIFLDPKASDRTKTVFNNRVFEPDPLWFWYWYSYRYYFPNPTYKPNIKVPAQGQKPPTIPGADFANNIATAIEKSANNFVVNMEKFANSIIPSGPKQKSSNQPVQQKAKCVCACATCACACACVSCACACAGGGVG
ncbi:MAG: hypothetical protein P8X91_08710 [Candidatus Bathyarchaeota archaeon]